ncbi:AAA family ATPase [Cellulomonas sp. APG4]|uniref:ATP-binding protein n=1 Tax=Cellulomonas sp. APG4 TaxID=1538656 RepID=UPI00137B63BD|nr:AAA family ATPase [Cellulomonas sp. APG4]NCT90130.1 AAA family ATPase [Cellulomonas sp. APG4]
MARATAMEKVAGALDRLGIEHGEDIGKVLCPAHEDVKPSLSVAQGEKGVVMACFAGCATEAVVKALGLKMSDLYDRKKGETRVTGRYEYRSPTKPDRVLFTQVRREESGVPGKRYTCTPQGAQDRILRKLGALPLYNEHLLLERPDDKVYLVEGEGNADRLNAWLRERGKRGVAVSHCNGAANWRPCYADPLARRDVVVVVDRDEAGEDWAAKVAADVAPVAKRLRFVQSATTGEKDDVVDHLDAGYGLKALVPYEPADPPRAPTGRPRFVVVSAADLAAPVPPMEWLVKGVWPTTGFGVLGGEKKTLKTYNLMHMALAVASGTPMFDQFSVPAPRTVLYLLGEGGQGPSARRLQRIAEAMGLPLEDLPLFMTFDPAPADTPEWQDAVSAALDTFQPGLVMLDPLYAFHPHDIEAQNLYSRGQMLTELNGLLGREAAFVVADHFKKTGSGALDLDSIAQVGMSQWADSWILQRHRSPAQVEQGDFYLEVEFGSRQWGGRTWEVDWHLGAFDDDTGEHDGVVKWDVRPSNGGGAGTARRDASSQEAKALQILKDKPEGLTRTDLRKLMTGRQEKREDAINALLDKGWIVPNNVEGKDSSGRKRTTTVLVADVEKITGHADV